MIAVADPNQGKLFGDSRQISRGRLGREIGNARWFPPAAEACPAGPRKRSNSAPDKLTRNPDGSPATGNPQSAAPHQFTVHIKPEVPRLALPAREAVACASPAAGSGQRTTPSPPPFRPRREPSPLRTELIPASEDPRSAYVALASASGYKVGRLLGVGGFCEVRLMTANWMVSSSATSAYRQSAGKFFICNDGEPTSPRSFKIADHYSREMAALMRINEVRQGRRGRVAESGSIKGALPAYPKGLCDFFSTPPGSVPDIRCIMTEYAAGGDVMEHIMSRVPTYRATEAEAQNLARSLFSALALIHECRIIHADIKPENVYILERDNLSGGVTIGDFGLAEVAADADPLAPIETRCRISRGGDGSADARPKHLRGTFAYMAPEILRGWEQTYESDVWSAALTCFVALTGFNPFCPVANASRVKRQALQTTDQTDGGPEAAKPADARAKRRTPPRKAMSPIPEAATRSPEVAPTIFPKDAARTSGDRRMPSDYSSGRCSTAQMSYSSSSSSSGDSSLRHPQSCSCTECGDRAVLHERIGAMRILHADIRDTIGNLLHRVSASDKAIRFFSKTLTESPYERPSASECLEMGWVSGKDDAGGDNADVFVDTIAVTDDQRCQLSASPSPGTTDSSDEHTL